MIEKPYQERELETTERVLIKIASTSAKPRLDGMEYYWAVSMQIRRLSHRNYPKYSIILVTEWV
jgi:hypothetical protein